MEVVATVSCRVCVYVCVRARIFGEIAPVPFVLISHSFPTRLFYAALFDRVNDTPPYLASGARRIFSRRITNEIDLCSKCASPRHGRRVRANDDEHFPPAIIIHNVQRDFRGFSFLSEPFYCLAGGVCDNIA